MDKTLFEKLAKEVCEYFECCNGCPFSNLADSIKGKSCDRIWREHPKDSKLALATWLGGTENVRSLAEKEPQKAPETRQEILQDAERCVCGDRDSQYGSPENSFRAIASMWNSYLYAKGLIENNRTEWKGIVPQDVAAMMVLFKMARVATGQNKADNWIDGAGYAACGGEIAANKESG